MSFEYIEKIPTADAILKELPFSSALKDIKSKRDKEIRDAFEGRSKKFIVIVGPCSADNEEAVVEYANRLCKVQAKVKDALLLIPRTYTNKPRTTGEGYKGMVYQPDPTQEPDIIEGLRAIRRMHIRVVKESGLTAADEMLYPGNYPYLEDVLSYVAVGARSVENQQHRLTASGLDVPVGMKNPTSGDLNIMLNSIYAAQKPHTFIYHQWVVKTTGNPLAHAILRGAFDPYGKNIPNYHFEDLIRCADLYLKKNLINPTIIVDASHANSNKIFSEQPRVAKEVIESIKKSDVLKKMIRGIMVESYLVEGAQDVAGGVYGKSITDPCLGWEDSEEFLYNLAEQVAGL